MYMYVQNKVEDQPAGGYSIAGIRSGSFSFSAYCYFSTFLDIYARENSIDQDL